MAEVSTGAEIVDVSVFIPAHNAARTVGRCVAAARRCAGDGTRITVINDRSTDGTADIARRAGAEVIDTPAGTGGLGVARQLALRSCRTRYLAFLNADCYPRRDWLRILLAELAEAGAAAAGGKQDELRDGTIAERWKAVHLRQDLGDHDIDEPDYLSGGNFLIDLSRLHGTDFDPMHTIAYEDVAFCRKLRAAGERLIYRAAAGVEHDHHETLWTLPRKVWSYGAFSKSVGSYRGVGGALRAFVRMHRRPHDQIRAAIKADIRATRFGFLAVDLGLLTASLMMFIAEGVRSASGPPASAT